MESIKTINLLTKTRHRCESGNPSMRSNLGFTDTSSLESIFAQLGVSPPNPGRGTESVSRVRVNHSSEPRILKVARKSFDTLDVGKTRPHERHLKINPELLAHQITLIELKLFQAIQPEEFLSLKWNSKEKLKYAPNIVASTRWFNQIIFWVQKDILNEENLSRRAEVLSHFVRIAKKLIEVNNYSSAMAIVSGLLVQSVYRLSATWAALPSRDRSAFRKLADLFSQDQNFAHLRTAIDTARLPCIPYLGIYLSDLTYIDVAAATASQQENGGSWGSQGKRDRLNNVLRIIANFQQSIYPFVRDEKIACYLEAQRYIEELQRFIEDNNYKLSLRLEPPTPDTVPSQPTDSTYPFPVKTNWFASSVLKPVFVSSSTSETGPVVASGLDRRSAGVPRGPSLSLGEMNSAQSSPTSSSTRRRPSPVDQALGASNLQLERQSSGADHEHSSPMVEDYLFSCSSDRPFSGSQHLTTGHRRLGSWTGVGFSVDSATRDDHSGPVTSLLKELSPNFHRADPNTANSSWSTSSGSTGRSLLVMDQLAPVQQPLGPLLDQTDLSCVPSALSSNVPMVQPNHDTVHSSSSGHPTGQPNNKSTCPRALGIMLPNLTSVQLAKPMTRPLGSGSSGSGRSRIAFSGSTETPRTGERHQTSSLATARAKVNPNSPTGTTESTFNRARSRHSASQPRTNQSVADKRRRKSPTKLEQLEQQKCKQRPLHGSVASCSLRTTDCSTTAQPSESVQSKNKLFTEYAIDIRDSQSRSYSTALILPSQRTRERRPTSPDCTRVAVHTSSFLIKGASSTSDASSGACSHSSFLGNSASSPNPMSPFKTDGSMSSTHLAQAALAAVEGTVADELARLSATERRSFVSNSILRPCSPISPVKAVCLDVQFANSLRVLREGVILFSRSSNTAFKKAQHSQLSQRYGELNSTATTLFGSCDALDTLRQRPDLQSKWHASFTESTIRHTSLEVPGHSTDQLSVSMLTPSPSHSLSQASLASFVLDLPSPSSALSSSSSSSWGSSTPSLPRSPRPPSANLYMTQASHSTNSRCSPRATASPCNYLEHCMTAPEKRRILGWFRRFRSRSYCGTKLRWGVLIQSNTHASNQVFLVLFKLHRTADSRLTMGSVGHLTAPPAAVTQPNLKCKQKSDGSIWRSSLPRAQITYTPGMFSVSHCQVLCIGSVVVDDCTLTRIPTLLVSDLIGPKPKIYRLSPASHAPITSDTQTSEDPHDLLVTMFQCGCNTSEGTGDEWHAGSTQRTVYRDPALRLPLTNLRKAEAALRSLRRLWPATWTAARRRHLRRDVHPHKNKSLATDHSRQNSTPTSQSSMNGPDLDQTGAESYPAWLPLLSLFPDHHPKR